MKCGTDKQKCRPLWVGGGVLLGLGVAVLVGFVIMWLWNGLMPSLFGLTEIGYWQGLGLALLGRLLFGGVGNGGSERKKHERNDKRHHVPFPDNMKDWEYYDKWWNEEGERSFRDYAGKISGSDTAAREEV